MRGTGCERSWELDAYREGRLGEADALSFERHLRSCAVCASTRSSDERLRDLARALPDEQADTLRMRRVRRRIMNDAAMGHAREGTGRGSSARLRVGVALATALGCATAAAIGYRSSRRASETAAAVANGTSEKASSPAPSPFAGSVQPGAGSRWSQSRDRDVETVRLDEGTLSVHVRPQLVYERFLVSVPDGEIEVRGTTFDVTVEGGKTTGVQVADGVVELRLAGWAVRRIGAGEAWPEKAAPDVEPQAPLPRVRVAAHRETAPTTAPSSAVRAGADDGAAAYSEAMGLLGAGRNGEAAAALRAFAVAHPDAPQVEDATFLEAVALARAGRTDAAGLAAEQHLARFPSSFHRKEAVILVDRAARLRGDASSP